MKKGERKWHDANEMPRKNGVYFVEGVWASGKKDSGEIEYKVHDGYFRTSWNFEVIRWRNL